MGRETNHIYGINPVFEKLKASPHEIEEILIAQEAHGPALRSVEAFAQRLGLRVQHGSTALLDRLAAGQRHQGVAARVAPFQYWSMGDLLHRLSLPSAPDRILMLDGLTDPRNFGALLRTAEAAGVGHVVIPKDRSVAVTAVVAKASAGAAHHMRIYKATNLSRAIVSVKERGYWAVGLDHRSPDSVYERVYPEKLTIVLGSEGKGMRPLVTRACDFLVSIPMLGQVASLNVGVAGAIFLYEVVRQRRYIDKPRAKG